jgi:hypothetical protein
MCCAIAVIGVVAVTQDNVHIALDDAVAVALPFRV